MRHYRTLLLLLAVAAVAGGAVLTPPITAGDKKDEPPPAKGDDKPGLHLTIYNDNIKRSQVSTLPDGLLTRPTLVWELEAKKAGKHLVEVSYVANQIRWRSDYNLVLNPDDTKVDVSGWVTIENSTGTAFDQARV